MIGAVARRAPIAGTTVAANLVGGPWGWLPLISVSAGAGMMAYSVANGLTVSRADLSMPLFWLTFVLIGPLIIIRLAHRQVATRERVGLLLLMAVALFLVRLIRSPLGFTSYDELQHWRSLADILRSGHLFHTNPLLTVSPLFPGLEVTTAAIAQLFGADPFTAAVTLLAGARLLFALALFALFREASGSERIGALGAALYMVNPNFAFFDGQFAYESLALPFVPVVLLLTAARGTNSPHLRLVSAGLVLSIVTVVVTHHITSYALTVLLLGWTAIHLVRRHADVYRRSPFVPALIAVGAALMWLLTVANLTIQYLGPPIAVGLAQAVKLISTGQGRTLFASATGQVAPLWERLAGFGSAGLFMLAIPIGLWVVARQLRANSLAILLALVATAYPVSLVGRLTPSGSEVAGRSLAVIFLGLAFLSAIAVVAVAQVLAALGRRYAKAGRPLLKVPFGITWRAAAIACVLVLVLGGIAVGTSPATRLPGPYLVGADSRSIDEQSLTMTSWTRSTLGTGRSIAADRVNRLLLGSLGEEHVVFLHSVGIETWQIFLSPTVGRNETTRLQHAGIRYLVIDRRLSTSLPLVPFYYEEGEILYQRHTQPVADAVLAKWDAVPAAARIYDSGSIQVYDVGRLSGAR